MILFAFQRKRAVIRFAFFAISLAAVGCGGGEASPTASSTAPSVAAIGDHPARALAAWIGRSILDKLVDEATFQSKKHEVGTDLELFDAALASVDTKLRDRVHGLRQQLESKASLEDIRRIVGEAVADLESRVQQADQQVTNTEARVRQLEEIIGYVPTVTPSPLLRINADGKPEAHPLTVKWTNLLAKSHVHWIEMEKLNQIYKPNAPEMRAAVEQHHKFQTEAVALRQEIKQQLAVALQGRMKLLETRRFNHPAVRDFDASIASLTWLAKIVQIEEKGAFKGMLVVPEQLVGPAASDIVATFELAGSETKDLVPLYERLLHLLPYDKKDDLQPIQPPQAAVVEEKFLALNGRVKSTFASASRVDDQLRELRKKHSELHPQVVALNKQRVDLLRQIRDLNSEANTVLVQALRVYVENLKVDRLENAAQKRLTRRLLKPVAELAEKSHCFDWENTESLQATWTNFLQAGEFFGREHEFAAHVAMREKDAAVARAKKLAEDKDQRAAFLKGGPQSRAEAAHYLRKNNLLTDEMIAEVLPELKKLLKYKDAENRYWGIHAIGALDSIHDEIIQDLANVLITSDGYYYRFGFSRDKPLELLEIIGKLGPRAKQVTPTLEKAIQDKNNREIRIEILKAKYLVVGDLAENDVTLICEALEEAGKRYAYEVNLCCAYDVVRQFKAPRQRFVRAICSSIAESNRLRRHGSDYESYLIQALELLRELGPDAADARSVIEPLLRLDERDAKIRTAAAEAIRRIAPAERKQ